MQIVGSCPPVNWLAPTAMPAMQSEQKYAIDLIPSVSATNTAKTGNWSDTSIWSTGRVPVASDIVWIPEGVSVALDIQGAVAQKVRIDGKLYFVDNSSLSTDTVLVEPTGEYDMGATDPGIRQTLTFTDSGPINTVLDPKQMGRGLIAVGIMNADGTMGAMATTNINGAPKTAFSPMQNVKAGTDQVTVADATGWRVGDTLLLHGTVPNSDSSKYQDDVRKIIDVQQTKDPVYRFAISLDSPLTYDHVAIESGLTVYAANLTRNIVIQSASTSGDPQRNGHIMFMHTDGGSFSYFEMDNLGRTDALKTINDCVVDASGKLVPGTGTNQRARYAIHWHRLYNYDPSCLVTITGCVVNGCPGVGMTNHSSNINFVGNVIYKVVGQGIMAEAGDEIGLIKGNFICHVIGRPGADRAVGSRQLQTDLTNAKQGNGIWLTSNFGVAVENNVTSECPLAGTYIDGSRLGGMIQPSFGVTNFPSFLVPPEQKSAAYANSPTYPVGELTLTDFIGNTSIADTFFFWDSWQDSFTNQHGTIQDCTAWNCLSGIGLGFVNLMDRVRVTLLGSDQLYTFYTKSDGTNQNIGVMITQGYGTDGTNTDVRIEHFDVGLEIPRIGHSQTVLHNGHFNCATNIWIGQAYNFGDIRTIDGDVTFAAYERLAGRTQYNYYLDQFVPNPDEWEQFSALTKPSVILLNTTDHPGMQLWQARQSPNVNPWTPANVSPIDLALLPPDLTSKTNAQAMAAFNRCFMGQCAPPDAVPLPLSNALISRQIPPPPNWNLSAYSTFFNKPGVTLNVFANYTIDMSNFTVPAHLNHEGWNFVPITHGGQKYAVFAYLDSGPATITVSPFQPSLKVKTADLSKPFTLYYYVDFGKADVSERQVAIVTPSSLPMQTRPDGTKFVSAHVTGQDKSGNFAAKDIAIEVTP